ncbi:hypothetical protein D5F01_LYC21046 [Larimichthys crocea]|uniref:Translin-associated factor X-interacting protein 1 N-terminal domain-containing protein n=1 Tax=Larimichthys crocea TaxID=215358 RepID=A0A6G0HMQ5_LARCR|nr:hypothetical protein D5F01_LYC21046 [Larimichthys crocea]
MSNSSKPNPTCFSSDIHRLLLAAEAGQKVDILTYCSGHLGPRSLNQSQPQKEKNQSFWNMSQSFEGTPNPLTVPQTRTKTLTFVKKNEIKESSSEFSTGTTLVESEVSRSRRGQATDRSSQTDRGKNESLPKIVYCSSNSLPVQPRALSQKKSNFSADPEGKQQFCLSHSDEKKQLETKQRFGRQVIGKPDPRAGINVAELHERKLEKELKKLSAQSWPSRDRLVVFSDVFDDVCEGSPVFGRILREIKTDYDLYVNHLMSSQSSLQNMSPNTSLKDLGNGKVREMELEDAEKEVSRLEQEAREALEENKRVRNELQNVPTITGPEDSDMKNRSLSELQDRGTAISCTTSVQSKRLHVVNVWREIQQLEEEIKEKMVPTAAATATERSIKDLKTEIMRLIASNDCLRTANKDLTNNINMVLNREKASKAIRRMLWEEINCDLQTESE